MSGETVTSRNGLQFTNDNKHAYLYSGGTSANNGLTTIFEFNTNSEYLIANISFYTNAISNDDFNYLISFNNIDIVKILQPQTYQSSAGGYVPIELIIPPFTAVKCTLQNFTDASTLEFTATVTAKVGMPQRVGNLDE